MLSICTQSSRWYQENDPEGSLRFIRECGFEGIDYNINNLLPASAIRDGRPTAFFNQSIEELLSYYKAMKEALIRNQIEVSQAHAPFPVYVAGNDELNDYLIMVIRKCCAVCRYLGCPALVVHPFANPDRDLERKVNLEMYRRMIPFAREYGVTICLENMQLSRQNQFTEAVCSTAQDACFYIDTLNEEAGETLFGFCLDVGHANLMKRNIRTFIRDMGERLTVLHIHDNAGLSDGHLIPYTQNSGGVDWDSFVEGLKDICYTGSLSFETFYGIFLLPGEAQGQGLKLLSAIGRTFRRRIMEMSRQ